jgi:hypothetical protein
MSGQLGIIGLQYLVMPLEQGSVSFNMCLHLERRDDHLEARSKK